MNYPDQHHLIVHVYAYSWRRCHKILGVITLSMIAISLILMTTRASAAEDMRRLSQAPTNNEPELVHRPC